VGKITGFMEFKRQEEAYLPPATRLKNYGIRHHPDQ
jgi:glutamate synthase (NADPH/NADH) small chain